MSPAIILAALDGAISMIEKLAPMIKSLFQSGDITVEQQKALADRIAALQSDNLFDGPEWKVDGN